MLGDCHSEPEAFWGVYDSDPQRTEDLPGELKETLAHFAGSFNRYSPTAQSGSTAGEMLYAAWNKNLEGKCAEGETPLECELRVHQPSIVIIHLGTHWEARNERYMTLIIERVLEHGAIPILATKGDNLEGDERLNRQLIELAEQYGLPVWNFWAAIQHLPDGGIIMPKGMNLTQDALEIQRYTGLQVLDAVWRMANPEASPAE